MVLGRVPDHSEEVASGTGQNAQVPNKMTVSHSLRGKELLNMSQKVFQEPSACRL